MNYLGYEIYERDGQFYYMHKGMEMGPFNSKEEAKEYIREEF